jgi:hypothetical protein
MASIQESENRIAISEHVPVWVRGFLTIIGLIAIIFPPYDLLIRPGWGGFTPILILPVLISLGAIMVGSAFVIAGLLGLDQVLVVDGISKTVLYAYQSTIMPVRRYMYTFSQVSKISVIDHEWSEGPSTYSIRIFFQDNRKIDTASFPNRQIAEEVVSKIEKLTTR